MNRSDARLSALLTAGSDPRDAFGRAAGAAGGTVDRSFRIAGREVRLRFAGDPLVTPVTRALAHLASPGHEPADLTVSLWDSASTGVDPPALPAVAADGPEGASYYWEDGPARAVHQPGRPSWTLFDREGGCGWHWVGSAAAANVEVAGPLRTLFGWWAEEHGLRLVHAASVGDGDAGVLVAGRGGSGKSTTSLVCLRAGLRYAGDDRVLVDPSVPAVHSLYSAARLEPEHARTFPDLLPCARPDRIEGDKAVVFLHEHVPELVARRLELRAVVVPRVVDGPTRVRSCSPASALAALAPSSVLTLPGAGQAAFEATARLVGALPCYALDLGSDPRDIAPAVIELLTR